MCSSEFLRWSSVSLPTAPFVHSWSTPLLDYKETKLQVTSTKNEHKYVLVETCISQPCNDGELPEYTETQYYLFSYCHLKLMLFDALFFSKDKVFVTLFSWHHSKQNILTTNCNKPTHEFAKGF